MNRAYSILSAKAVGDTDERVIEGIATTPSPDRMQDIVEPLGVQFKNPLVLLHQHDHGSPVGSVTFHKPTKEGIKFRAILPKITEPGPLKDRVDMAWSEIKAGLIRAVSIGFRPLEMAYLESGGVHFLKSEVVELSLVSVPAQADATITLIKSIDAEAMAASGHKSPKPKTAAIGTKHRNIEKGPVKMAKKQSIAEQITAFRDTRNEKSLRMNEIMDEAEGSTLDESQTEEFDNLEAEVAQIDAHVKRLRTLQKSEAENAKPVGDVSTAQKASESRGNVIHARVKAQAPGAGIRFARLARVKALSAMQYEPQHVIAEKLFGTRDPEFVSQMKAAVGAHNTGTSANGGFLVGEEGNMFADFVEFLRPQTVLGKFGQGGIPSLRQVPFRVPLIGQTTGGAGYWVGEGKAKPLTAFEGSRNTIEPLKVANIAVATMELLRDSSPSAEAWLRDQLAAALRARLDTDFIDPAKAASAGVSPASITNGATAVVSNGGTADDIRMDIRGVFQKFIDANNAPTDGVWIMSNTNALALSLMLNPLGQAEFPGMNMNGGTLQGLPVIATQYAGNNVTLVNASDIYFADDGGINVDFSREASLEMDSAPTQDSIAPTASASVSMFQTNSVAFRAERTLNWARRRTSSVVVLTGVAWGGAITAGT